MKHSESIKKNLEQALGGSIPHDDSLGITYQRPPAGQLRLELPYSRRLTGVDPAAGMDAGVIATALDTACGTEAISLSSPHAVSTLDLRIDYLRRSESGKGLMVEARQAHAYEDFMLMEALAWHDDPLRPLARAVGRFIVHTTSRAIAPESVPSHPNRLPQARYWSPYAAFMDFRAMGRGAIAMPFRPDLVGNSSLPSLHGGAIVALLQQAAERRVHGGEGQSRLWLASIGIDFLRFGRPLDTTAEVRVQRIGRSVASVRVVAHQGDEARPNAEASAHFHGTSA